MAQDVRPEDQYKAYLTRAQTVTPVGSFGEQINLRQGALSFKNIDIEVPGIGPTIRIVRTIQIEDGQWHHPNTPNALGGWEIEVPRIQTIAAFPNGWLRAAKLDTTSPTGWKSNRCTGFGAPANVTYGDDFFVYPTSQWWFGHQLIDASGEQHELFSRAVEMPNKATFKLGTASNWVVSCLPQIANPDPNTSVEHQQGEAFLAISPDGTKYRFDHLNYSGYASLILDFEFPDGHIGTYGMPRKAASMLVTRIEDRFGNSLTYSYSGGVLTGITASDGRSVTINRQTGSVAVTVGSGALARTWTYTIAGTPSVLTTVTQPDGSTWNYTGPFHRFVNSQYQFTGCSQNNPYASPDARQLIVTAPSGATATFDVDRRIFGRSYVPKYCSGPITQMEPDAGYAYYSRLWISHALLKKTVTGPGLGIQIWNYSYSPHNGSWEQDCTTTACPTTVWTDVVNPSGERFRSHFSNKWDQTENKLVKEEVFSASGERLRWVDYAYATADPDQPNPYPWPLRIGYISPSNYNDETRVRWTPERSRVIHQDGMTYTRTTTSYDLFARPTAITKTSAGGTP